MELDVPEKSPLRGTMPNAAWAWHTARKWQVSWYSLVKIIHNKSLMKAAMRSHADACHCLTMTYSALSREILYQNSVCKDIDAFRTCHKHEIHWYIQCYAKGICAWYCAMLANVCVWHYDLYHCVFGFLTISVSYYRDYLAAYFQDRKYKLTKVQFQVTAFQFVLSHLHKINNCRSSYLRCPKKELWTILDRFYY